MKYKLKKEKAITLIALVITVIVLLILAGVTVATITGENGLLNKASSAGDETKRKTAEEKINLKITTLQMKKYSENQIMPTLQNLADELCEDNEIEYVHLKEQQQASLEKIIVGETDSILTKLKEYPYEFEIDSSLRLASINGVKIASNADGTLQITQNGKYNVEKYKEVDVQVEQNNSNNLFESENLKQWINSLDEVALDDILENSLTEKLMTSEDAVDYMISDNTILNSVLENSDATKKLIRSPYALNKLIEKETINSLMNDNSFRNLFLSETEIAEEKLNSITKTVPQLSNNTNVISGTPYDSNYQGWRAFDNNDSTRFASQQWGIPNYIGYDFGEDIDIYKVYWKNPTLSENINTYKIQYYSEENSSWLDATNVLTTNSSANSGTNTVYLKEHHVAKKWRVYIVSSTSSQYVNVVTVQFYGI